MLHASYSECSDSRVDRSSALSTSGPPAVLELGHCQAGLFRLDSLPTTIFNNLDIHEQSKVSFVEFHVSLQVGVSFLEPIGQAHQGFKVFL